MNTPMQALEEIVAKMALTHSPRAKELLEVTIALLVAKEEDVIQEAYEAGRNSIEGSSHEVSERKAVEYFNKKFK